MHRTRLQWLVLAALVLSTTIPLGASPALKEQTESDRSSVSLHSSVIASAGGIAASSNYGGRGTLGQSSPVGWGEAAQSILYSGFWGHIALLTRQSISDEMGSFVNGLFQNRPNPARCRALIQYSVAQEGQVRLDIFDLSGRKIRTLVNGEQLPGRHAILWDGSNDRGAPAGSGVYFYRLRIGAYHSARRMLMIR